VLAIALGLGGWALAGQHPAGQHLSGHHPSGHGPGGHVTGNRNADGVGQVPVPRGLDERAPSGRGQERVPRPVKLAIPAIGVHSRLVRLGITRQHTLQVPASAAIAGWFTGSPRPGAIGASIIAGHIDSHTGPGVFFRLKDLHQGERVYIDRLNGSVAAFRIISVRTYAKQRFPTRAVYGPVPDAELRLITCGGQFDYSTGSYLSNVVVSAVLVR